MKRKLILTVMCALMISLIALVGSADKVTITTLDTMARLCPYPNAGENQHITRMPKGTVLEVEGIMDVKSGMLSVKWFEVSYKGKRGWVSIYDTDKQ